MLLLTVVLFVLQRDLLVSSFQYVTIQIPYLFIPTLTFAETIVFLPGELFILTEKQISKAFVQLCGFWFRDVMLDFL